MLHLLTTRVLARAPARAFVSATTFAALIGAGALTALPSRPHAELTDVAVAQTRPTAPAAVVVPPVTPPPALRVVAAAAKKPMAADLNCLAKAVYYEARGESEDGQAAVAQVVLNRTHSRRYAHNVCGVVFQGADAGQCQFSFACNGAMDRPLEPAAWSRARRIARAVFSGQRKAPVGEAISFHTIGEGGGGRAVARIGGHLFFAAA